jgi:hypothetical protein
MRPSGAAAPDRRREQAGSKQLAARPRFTGRVLMAFDGSNEPQRLNS